MAAVHRAFRSSLASASEFVGSAAFNDLIAQVRRTT
jgi:hypothetical protein